MANVIYDSGSVASGAVITSPVIEARADSLVSGSRVAGPIGMFEVLINNTAGTAMRQLTMTSYLSDGVTVIDTIPLRNVAFGTASTGSVYAPGSVRGYVGPNPPGGTSGYHVLTDVTSAVNTALDTGLSLVTEDLDSVDVEVVAGGSTNVAVGEPFDDGTGRTIVAPTGAANVWIGIGLGHAGGGNYAAAAQVQKAPGRRVQVTTTAVVGQTVRLQVRGKGRVPGTFSVQMMLPPSFSLSLAAAGTGAARMTVLGSTS